MIMSALAIRCGSSTPSSMNWKSLKKFIRAVDQRLDDYLRRLDEGDVEEVGTGGGARTKNLVETIAVLREKRGHYQVMLAELERTGEAQISLTDPDCRAMAAIRRLPSATIFRSLSTQSTK
jgi:hypothetical protein